MIQLQCLNYILDKKDSQFISENELTEDFFSDYKDEFKFIKSHWDQFGNIPDKETFLSKFNNFDIIDVRETPEFLFKQLNQDRNTRTLARTFNTIRDLLSVDKVDEAMVLFTNASQQVSSQNKITKAVDILTDKSRYDAYVEKTQDFTKYFVKTGFKELDSILGGWDRKEDLVTIVARSNMGKTWMLLKVALAAAEQGLRVGIYSGEMTSNKIGYRIDTLFSHISNKALIHGDIQVMNEYKLMIDSMQEKIKGSIKVLTPSMISGPAGVMALRNFIESEDLDMLCIDQHSLLEDDQKAKNPVEKASNISRDLKNLQVLKQIPIISVSQQNRTSTENGLDLTHIAQADRIGQDSTIVIFFEKREELLTLHLIKSRDSENGQKIQYVLDLDKGIFTYIPVESDTNGKEQCENLKEQYEDRDVGEENVF